MVTEIDICNNALDLIGEGLSITSFDDQTKQAELCKRLYPLSVERCLAKYYFSFARRDEVLTKDNLIDYVSLPYRFTYKIPNDVQTILYLEQGIRKGGGEKIDTPNIDFNFREIHGQRCIVTDTEYPITMHYQAKITDTNLFPSDFTEALEYCLGARLATACIKGATGIQISTQLMSQGIAFLSMAAGHDSQQGADSIQTDTPSLIKARY